MLEIDNADKADIAEDGGFIKLRNILARPIRGSREILVFFNGSVRPDQLKLAPIFQRWSWHKQFSPTLFFVSDPSVQQKSKLHLAWYAGRREWPVFERIFETIDRMVVALHGTRLPITCFGSSAGGFASLMAVATGRAQRALAINPQTNVLKYWEAVRKQFLTYYCGGEENVTDADLPRLSVHHWISQQGIPAGSKIHVLQNHADAFHFNNHFMPLVKAWAQHEQPAGWASFEVAYDPVRQHNPPPLGPTVAWINSVAPSLIQSDATLQNLSKAERNRPASFQLASAPGARR